jgi:hypothetical protein
VSKVWRICVEVPGDTDEGHHDLLFTAVADAAYDWEENYPDRGDWDINVYAHKVDEDIP